MLRAIRFAHYDVIDDVKSETIRHWEQWRPYRPMKSSDLSTGENKHTDRQTVGHYETNGHLAVKQ